MKYLSTKEIATIWNISERTVRDYCSKGRVIGALFKNNVWIIPENAKKPSRKQRITIKQCSLLQMLKEEKDSQLKGGIYHKLQVEMTYNSNHIEGSTLTHDETKYIFETNTIGQLNQNTKIDDILETINHFKCIDLAIDSANYQLSESLIKQFHLLLKYNTNDSKKPWFNVGDYKQLENEVGDRKTASPKDVKNKIKDLLDYYNNLSNVTINDIIEFHYRFETIHPFQDGNGRVGRLIMLKECLKHNFVPILITESNKNYYYRGLSEWNKDKAYLIDTCLYGQDIMKTFLDSFNIRY